MLKLENDQNDNDLQCQAEVWNNVKVGAEFLAVRWLNDGSEQKSFHIIFFSRQFHIDSIHRNFL